MLWFCVVCCMGPKMPRNENNISQNFLIFGEIFLFWSEQTPESLVITSPPIGGGRGIVMPMSVCLFVCLCVCLSVFSQNFKV